MVGHWGMAGRVWVVVPYLLPRGQNFVVAAHWSSDNCTHLQGQYFKSCSFYLGIFTLVG